MSYTPCKELFCVRFKAPVHTYTRTHVHKIIFQCRVERFEPSTLAGLVFLWYTSSCCMCLHIVFRVLLALYWKCNGVHALHEPVWRNGIRACLKNKEFRSIRFLGHSTRYLSNKQGLFLGG